MTPKRVVFHLGTYKTGTSTVQNTLFRNRELLKKHSILYPETGLYRSMEVGHRHRGIITDFMEGRRNSYKQPRLHQEILGSGCDLTIMSSEAWSHPNHMALLHGLAIEMRDAGFVDISGAVFFRNIIDYKVSHYREFTFRSGNTKPYEEYHIQGFGMFDYLFLARQYRLAFGGGTHFINYDHSEDSVASLFGCLGISDVVEMLAPAEKANTKSIQALGIEVIRSCNNSGIKGKRAFDFLDRFSFENADLFREHWTERVPGDVMSYCKSYRRELSFLTGWNSDDVDGLLVDRPIVGRPVSEARKRIQEAIADWLRTPAKAY